MSIVYPVSMKEMINSPQRSNSLPRNAEPSGDPIFSVSASRGFTDWLTEHRTSLAVTTYQVGKLFLIGVRQDGSLWVFNRNVGRCLGIAAVGNTLWVAADSQILKLVDALQPGQPSSEGHDALYVPQVAYYMGDLDAHDIAVTPEGEVIFVNTLFNCLATISDTHSFTPIWRPHFISRLTAEDRCHLNGLARRDGQARYVSAAAMSDTFDGWRDQRHNGGIVVDVVSNEIISSGLSMPHSPRWCGGRLWLHNSGTGEFGWIEPASGKFQPLCFCPGYLRGLTFIGKYAVMGLSKPRQNKTFTGLALDEALEARKMEPRCGIYVVNIETGDTAHSLTMEGIVTELYDVVALPMKLQPAAVGPANSELKRMISIGP